MSTLPERSIKAGRLIPAAQYVRMSTDHQRYSTENQRDAIQAYADKHGIAAIVHRPPPKKLKIQAYADNFR